MITLVDKGFSLSETKYLGHRRRLVSTGFGFGRKKEEGAESYPRFTTGFNRFLPSPVSGLSSLRSFGGRGGGN